ncbi:MAG: homoserine O-acetyltransferase [Campylobacteraceae bacterium]|nr:homoserine O-acetyltransferase [Campylobacteraceae bacterium]
MVIAQKIEHFNSPLYLESGRILESYDIAYETYGSLNSDKSNVIVIFHALTGSQHAAGRYEGDVKTGWWDPLIGDGKIIDTTKFFVICANILGGCSGTTGPMSIDPSTNEPYRLKFPVITISDMVRAQQNLFSKLGLTHAYAVMGGSLGAMQALCCSIEYPDFAKRVICLAGTYATSPWAIAFNKIAMDGVINDPQFKQGQYEKDAFKEDGLLGLALGRMVGHISFLSPYSMRKKFDRNYVDTDGLYELFGRFQAERYLEYNGYSFSKRFDPLSYLYIIKAMNIFDAARNYESLKDSFSSIKAKMHLIAFKGDLLFLPDEMEVIRDTLCELGRGEATEFVCVDSDYGHDAFLVEYEKFDSYIKKALDEEV